MHVPSLALLHSPPFRYRALHVTETPTMVWHVGSQSCSYAALGSVIRVTLLLVTLTLGHCPISLRCEQRPTPHFPSVERFSSPDASIGTSSSRGVRLNTGPPLPLPPQAIVLAGLVVVRVLSHLDSVHGRPVRAKPFCQAAE